MDSDAAHTPRRGKEGEGDREIERAFPFGRELCCELEPLYQPPKPGELIAISTMHRPLHRGIARMLLFPRVASSYFAGERAVVRAASAGNPGIALIISERET